MDVPFNYNAAKNLELLHPRGFFLTSGRDGVYNTMTIGWGSVGVVWSQPCFTALVAHSRYTHELIAASGQFTVTVPYGDMGAALAFVGTHSGRDMDKFKAAGLDVGIGHAIAMPHVQCPGMVYECEVVFANEVTAQGLDEAIYQKRYAASGNFHTVFFGRIAASYTID